ncbi:MAG: hypothetical protein ACOYOU_13435 [Kiritimatiellia bacterium]
MKSNQYSMVKVGLILALLANVLWSGCGKVQDAPRVDHNINFALDSLTSELGRQVNLGAGWATNISREVSIVAIETGRLYVVEFAVFKTVDFPSTEVVREPTQLAFISKGRKYWYTWIKMIQYGRDELAADTDPSYNQGDQRFNLEFNSVDASNAMMRLVRKQFLITNIVIRARNELKQSEIAGEDIYACLEIRLAEIAAKEGWLNGKIWLSPFSIQDDNTFGFVIVNEQSKKYELRVYFYPKDRFVAENNNDVRVDVQEVEQTQDGQNFTMLGSWVFCWNIEELRGRLTQPPLLPPPINPPEDGEL